MLSYLQSLIEDPRSQRKLVLVIVCIALLLDNMLYMVIVPIIPHYLTNVTKELSDRYSQVYIYSQNVTTMVNDTVRHHINKTSMTRWGMRRSESAERQIGMLFASKAFVQLLINPISGTIIDKVGYDRPMMFGLTVICLSTVVFAFGHSYGVMMLARSLQGVGSAFADTSGLAMIADRFTEESERTKALGIALAFISFGSLVAPPFGGILYDHFGKVLPFLVLSSIALIDGCLMLIVMKPVRIERRTQKATGDLPKGTPIWRLLRDPYIATCAGALAMSNVSLAFLEPTISMWMEEKLKTTNTEEGMVWLPSFFPHVLGVYSTVYLARRFPKYQWLMAAVGLSLEGFSCLCVPFCNSFVTLMIPICLLCYGIALVDTALLPTLAFVVDHHYSSVYGSVYAIADISYSMAYAFGPVVAAGLVKSISFTGMNVVIFLTNVLYAPILLVLRNVYKYEGEFIEGEGENVGGGGGGGEGVSIQNAPKPHMRTYMLNGSDSVGAKPLDSKDDPYASMQPHDGGSNVPAFQTDFSNAFGPNSAGNDFAPPRPPPPPPPPTYTQAQQPGWKNQGPLD
ncbi:hypothetical protein BOX15_Mlig006694g1 [Macrostomum lignano]|uniref:MFS domain-containing protein n=3 Tax=Macrostomum lignano TaxID=282301 RepID=A0A1I8G693_9PLAT|nr:hypothetical protein BOX15_Mlig006694g1 [Macrostomum lignano]